MDDMPSFGGGGGGLSVFNMPQPNETTPRQHLNGGGGGGGGPIWYIYIPDCVNLVYLYSRLCQFGIFIY